MDFLIRSVSAKQHGTSGNMGNIPCKFFKPSHPFLPSHLFKQMAQLPRICFSSWFKKQIAIELGSGKRHLLSLWCLYMGVSLNGGIPKTPQNDHF